MTVHSRISHVHRHFPALLAIVGRYILTATRETLLHSALETQRSAAVIVSRSILDLKELHGLGQLLLDLDLCRTLERGSRVGHGALNRVHVSLEVVARIVLSLELLVSVLERLRVLDHLLNFR